MKIKIEPILDTLRLERISDEEYFGEKYKDYVSNSRLKLINPEQDGSPELFWEGINDPYNPSFVIGSAVHQLLLQPDDFELATNVDRPTAKLGMVCDILYGKELSDDNIRKACIDVNYYSSSITEKRIEHIRETAKKYHSERDIAEWVAEKTLVCLDAKNRDVLQAAKDAWDSNKTFQQIVKPYGAEAYNEWAFFIDFKVTRDGEERIIHWKSKLDNFTIDKEDNKIVVNDLKTTSSPLSLFRDTLMKFRYHRELAIYLYLLTLWVKKEYGMEKPKKECNLLVVQLYGKFGTLHFGLPNETILKGWNEFQSLLQMVANEYFKK